ncbi:MAG: RluA family pseudouridine synthase [Proteobacteria bacterium]|nr:RluA family pseudouridine synthase [Pseudomonadota bacterium]
MKKRPESIDSDWIEFEFVVPREYAGWRADRFISNRIPRLSRTRVQKILRRAGFDEEGKLVKPNRLISEGERITIFRRPLKEPEVPRHFDILFEDDWILAVDKPAGLPVHPTARYHHNTLTVLLGERYGEDCPILAHRIDSETSGVLLCAKTREVERALKIMFAERAIEKSYLALVQGIPAQSVIRVDAPLGPDKEGPILVKVAHDPNGLHALTEFRILQPLDGASLIECRPHTGRQHQIRAHLAHIGHPIIGDKMYGPDVTLFLEYLEHGLTEDIEQRAGARRHLLHSSSISLIHPINDEPLLVKSPIPMDMKDLMARLSSK